MWFYRLLAVVLVLGAVHYAQATIGPDKVSATSIELGSAGTSDTTITRASAGVIAVEGTSLLSTGTGQPLDSDLTSWAAITRASGFDTFTATPSMANLGTLLSDDASGWTTFGTTSSSANLKSLITDETGSGGAAVFATSPVLTTPEISSFELGAGQTDTTITRSAAGVVQIEGATVKKAGIQSIPLMAAAGTIPVGGAIAGCNPAATIDSGSNDVMFRVCTFNAATDQAIYWTIPMPKSADESVDLTARVDWESTTTTDGTDDVIWNFACIAVSNDDAMDGNAFPAVDAATDTQTAAGDFLSSPTITAITPAGTWAEGDALVCRLSRDADNGSDNFNGTADLIDVMLFYTDTQANDT